MTWVHCSSVIRNSLIDLKMPWTPPVHCLLPQQPPSTTDLFTVSVILPFPKWHTESYSMESFQTGFSLSNMHLRFLDAFLCLDSSFLRIIFHCLKKTHSVHPSVSWVIPSFGSCDGHCWEHSCTSFCLNTCLLYSALCSVIVRVKAQIKWLCYKSIRSSSISPRTQFTSLPWRTGCWVIRSLFSSSPLSHSTPSLVHSAL